MGVVPTLTEYSLIHYKQIKENTSKKMQDRLVVVQKIGKPKTLVIKKLDFWQRIRANWNYGPASKTVVLNFITKATEDYEHKETLDDTVRFIFSKEMVASDVRTVLRSISECHNRSLIEDVLKKPEMRAFINAKIADGDTALMLSIKNNNKEAFDALIHAEGIDLNASNATNEYTALLLAIELERIEFAKKLLEKGCDIPVKAYALSRNNPQLTGAIKNASPEQRSKLLVNAVEHTNTTAFKKILNEMHELDTLPALEKAIHDGCLEMVEIVIGHGLDKSTALQVALKQWSKGEVDQEAEVFKHLLNANRNNLYPALVTLAELHSGTLERTREEYVKLNNTITDHDEYILLRGEAGYRILTRAAERGNWNFVEALISAGANPNFEPNGASKLLLRAASRAGPEVIKLLLAHGADVTYSDSRNTTAIKRAELRLQYRPIPGGIDEAKSVLTLLQDELEKTTPPTLASS